MKESIKSLRKNYFAQECLVHAIAHTRVRARALARERAPDSASGENGSGLEEVRARVRGGWPLARVSDARARVCVCARVARVCVPRVHVHAGRAAFAGVCVHVTAGERRASVLVRAC